MRTVIIGAGPAGISAAAELAKRKPWEEVLVLAGDPFPYSRCMLHHYLKGERSEKGLSFIQEDFFLRKGINFLGGQTVCGLDTEKKQIQTARGPVPYDKLVVATGASYVLPRIPNLRSGTNVYGFRDLKDAKAVKAACATAKKAVVIGSGLVGMDVVSGLLPHGLKVTVVEMASRIMPLQTDQISAARYQRRFEKAGVRFLLGVGVSDTAMDGEGRIDEVILSDGTRESCDMLIVAVGVRPNVGFLENTEIFLNRGIQVDPFMQTTCPNVYAAGDVTGLSGIWPNAVEQGRIAAVNLSGGWEAYTDKFCIKNTCSFFGLPMLSVGSVGAEGDNYTILTQETPSDYKRLVLRDGYVVGALFQGDIAGTGIWQYLIKNRVDVSQIQKSLFQISIADLHCFDEDVRQNRADSVMRIM